METFEELEKLSISLETSAGHALVMADPHLGFELSRGLRIRTHFEEILSDFIVSKDPDLLIILGDLKEPLGLSFEMKEILLRFFSSLRDVRVVITKGNHDGRLEEVASRFSNVEVRQHYLLDGILFLHGHTQLPEVDFSEAYLGHAHPAYTFKSTVLRKTKVFVRVGKFLILPPINPFIEGFDVREGLKLVPFLRNKESVELFLPDGIYLGRVLLR